MHLKKTSFWTEPKSAVSYTVLTLWLSMLAPVSSAANVDWSYNGSTDWGNAANWSSGTVPVSSDGVRINQEGTQGPIINGGSFDIGGLALGETVGSLNSNGALIIQNGGELTTGSLSYIGASTGLNGSVSVSGNGSTWNANNAIFLGNRGNGSLTIENGGTVNMFSTAPAASNIYMGTNNPGGVDHLTITGANSSLNLHGWLLLAYGGNNSFHDTTSIVQVSDGAKITADGVDVGYGGHGILTVNRGGSIDTQHGLISPYAGSKGEVTITGQGSRWSVAEEMTIASSGNGTLIVSDRGLLESKLGNIAYGFGSIGNVNITGSGSRWDNSDTLQIGVFGNGTLTVSDGGLVESKLGNIADGSGSIGTVNITGSGSRWDNSEMLQVGVSGNGTLTINDGGYVSTGSFGLVGVIAGSTGVATVSGSGSNWQNAGALYIGYQGYGVLNITDSGTVSSSSFGALGVSAGSTGIATVSGSGSNWQNAGVLYIGYQGSGVLTISDGGTVSAEGGVGIAGDVGSTGILNIGAIAGQAPKAPGILDVTTVSFGDGAGSIVFNHNDNSDTYLFKAAIENQGSVDVYQGTTTLTGQSTYEGATTIHGGELATMGANVLSPNSAYAILSKGTLNLEGYSNEVDSLNNAGTINLAGASGSAGNRLSSSAYTSNGGALILNTVLGNDESITDRLVAGQISLGSAPTKVFVNNIGGAGARTVGNGIEIVQVLDSTNSAVGAFKLGSRVTAGLYEYDIYQGGIGANASDGNWYLRTLASPINPESTVYLRNLSAASTMFMHTLHDRLGEPQFTDSYKTEDNNPSSAWVRVVSNHTDSTGGNGQVDLNTDTNLVHLGTDIARWSNNGTDRWNIGLMGAYGQSKIDASPNMLGVTPSGFKRNASGKVDGYSVGGYATWYQNKDKPEGLYVDTWAQYGWYDNKVQGNTKAEESYNSTGWTASVEAGYAMVAREEGNNRQLMFEPQIQVAYNSYSSDDHTDANGTRITDNNANGVITRVGARLYSRSTLNDNGIQPFVEANWWYSDAKNSLAFNGETMSDGTPNSRYELKAGLQGEVAKNWLMWGHAGVQFGQNDFNRYEGMVGVKRIF